MIEGMEFTAKSRQQRTEQVELLKKTIVIYKTVICDLEDENRHLKEELNELETKIRWNLGVILINVIIIICLFLIAIN
jgi:hypothetical protein